MKTISRFNILKFLPLAMISLFAFTACESDSDSDDPTPTEQVLNFFLGWEQEDENLEEIPNDLYLGDGGNIPSAYDITSKYPPIGDQGAYGTCVAWAVGYNMKTALNAIDLNYSSSELASTSRQFSPKDLFLSIDNQVKGADCNGTNFEPALDVLINRGIATLATAPYQSLGDCSQAPNSTWTSEAANNKIANYREIAVDVNTIKSYLADNRPIVFGARLGDNFMTWNSDDVLSFHSGFSNVGQHAYHAMALSGYDDGKGPNGAFKVVNSWGGNWSNSGYIWVDYNFFAGGEFCFAAFVASNIQGEIDPDNPVDPNINGTADLVPWVNYDNIHPDAGYDLTYRQASYNAYNIGDQNIEANKDWSLLYMFYNAYDAEDYGIILYDYYSDDFGNPGEFDYWYDNDEALIAYWNHTDVPPNSSIAYELVGDEEFTLSYHMPNITGYYYLVLYADAFDNVSEGDEANNLFYMTDGFGGPVYIENGIVYGLKGKDQDEFANSRPTRNTEIPVAHKMSKEHSNAYTPAEISAYIKHQKKTGALQQKASEFASFAQQGKKSSPAASK